MNKSAYSTTRLAERIVLFVARALSTSACAGLCLGGRELCDHGLHSVGVQQEVSLIRSKPLGLWGLQQRLPSDMPYCSPKIGSRPRQTIQPLSSRHIRDAFNHTTAAYGKDIWSAGKMKTSMPKTGVSRATALLSASPNVNKEFGALRWPRDFGQGDKLFPLERETGRYGQGDTEALRG